MIKYRSYKHWTAVLVRSCTDEEDIFSLDRFSSRVCELHIYLKARSAVSTAQLIQTFAVTPRRRKVQKSKYIEKKIDVIIF